MNQPLNLQAVFKDLHFYLANPERIKEEPCSKCKKLLSPGKLVSGVCLICEPQGISEKTHIICDKCGDPVQETVEVEISTPSGIALVDYCEKCAEGNNEDTLNCDNLNQADEDYESFHESDSFEESNEREDLIF